MTRDLVDSRAAVQEHQGVDADERELAEEDEADKSAGGADAGEQGRKGNGEEGEADEQSAEESPHDDDAASSPSTPRTSASSAPLSSSSLSSFNSSLAQTGLLYFSRLPPHLKPGRLRQLLSCYGAIDRIFLTPEQSHLTRSRSSRTAQSASTVRRFVDGWVEFLDKRTAKAVARTLNGTAVGGRKRGYWYDDVWSVRYLAGFKWNHLTERQAHERQVREGRKREEVGRARKESDRYAQQVDQSRQIQHMQQRKGSKRQREQQQEEAEEEPRPRVLRTFYQRPVVPSKQLHDQ